jgi:hypothetical protein
MLRLRSRGCATEFGQNVTGEGQATQGAPGALSRETSYHGIQPLNCRFCATGSNVGVNEVAVKDVEHVVEVARTAKEEPDVTFVHFNSGHQTEHDLDVAAPCVKAVKSRVGALIGLPLIATLDFWKYGCLNDLGTDHFSFCYEFHDPEHCAKFLPGKEKLVGQQSFLRALEYTAKKLGKGACSGEIIAGIEPLEDTLKAVDCIAGIGAFPTVCIFCAEPSRTKSLSNPDNELPPCAQCLLPRPSSEDTRWQRERFGARSRSDMCTGGAKRTRGQRMAALAIGA